MGKWAMIGLTVFELGAGPSSRLGIGLGHVGALVQRCPSLSPSKMKLKVFILELPCSKIVCDTLPRFLLLPLRFFACGNCVLYFCSFLILLPLLLLLLLLLLLRLPAPGPEAT